MAKKFNIHDWQAKQAKQRLTENDRFPGEDEAGMAPRPDLNLSPKDKKAIQVLVGEYSINRVLNYIAVVVDRTGKHDEADMIQKLANQIDDFNPSLGITLNPTDIDEMSTTGTGTSVTPGAGEAYATPRAFKKKKK